MFRIVELEDCEIKQYVFLTDAESVESQLEDIYDALKDKLGSSFTVVVDTFLRSGFKDNRFIGIKFVDGKHVLSYINDLERLYKYFLMYRYADNFDHELQEDYFSIIWKI